MFTFVRVLLLLVEKQKQAKDYSVNSLQTNAEVNQAIYRGIIAICFLISQYIATRFWSIVTALVCIGLSVSLFVVNILFFFFFNN